MKSYPSLSLAQILPSPLPTGLIIKRHPPLFSFLFSFPSLIFIFVLMGGALWPAAQLFAIDFEKDDFFGSLNGSAEFKAPVAFVQKSIKEQSSFSLLLKTNASYGANFGFYGELRSGFDGSAQAAQDNDLFLSYDKVYPDKDWYIEVPEAYFSVFLADVDLRLGIQKFSWGTLDMINPTDNLNPLDMRHILTADALEKKVGIPALRALYESNFSYEAIWIPLLVPYRFPEPADRWYPPMFYALESINMPPLPPISVNIICEEADLPASTFSNSEFGLRISHTIGNMDIGLSYFSGYDRNPVLEADGIIISDMQFFLPELNTVYLFNLYPVFHRIQVFGVETAASLGSFTLRAEGAYSKGRYHNIGLDAIDELISQFQIPEDIFTLLPEMTFFPRPNGITVQFPYSIPMTYQKDTISIGGGIDYQWGVHMFTLQLIGDYIQGVRDEPLMFEPFELTIVLGLRSQFFEDSLSIEGGLVINPMENLYMVNTRATYSVSDTFKVGANLIVLDGQSLTPMGQYRNHDQVEFFARYSF